MSERHYANEAKEDSKAFVENFKETIVDSIYDGETISVDPCNGYRGGDEFCSETYGNEYFNLMEASEVLHYLREYEETDSGLWQDLNPEDAVIAKASWTYRNAVIQSVSDLLREIRDEDWSEVTSTAISEVFDSVLECGTPYDKVEKISDTDFEEEVKNAIADRPEVILDNF